MNKSELVAAVAEKTGQTKAETAETVDTIIDLIQGEVAAGNKVQLPGFLTFEKGHRPARTGRNPQTGEPVEIKAADVPKVKIGKAFKDLVNS